MLEVKLKIFRSIDGAVLTMRIGNVYGYNQDDAVGDLFRSLNETKTGTRLYDSAKMLTICDRRYTNDSLLRTFQSYKHDYLSILGRQKPRNIFPFFTSSFLTTGRERYAAFSRRGGKNSLTKVTQAGLVRLAHTRQTLKPETKKMILIRNSCFMRLISFWLILSLQLQHS